MIVEPQAARKCPACESELSRSRGIAGLCPACLLELALDDTALEAELEPGEAPTLQFTPGGAFAEGEIQGERYRIRSLLGRGGMGEVWRAYDLKLRLDVALKALRAELIQSQEALETLRQEVRVAREVVSPNVCRVFDLEELDGQELISMEYVDGTTLQEILKERGPLELNEAREIASQFLAGLEAIHEAGLVHRDIKPENVMLTRTGRVVVMDFGIAKGLGDGKSGMVAGTPAYMAPEQAKGGEIDARADLFSAGVVLAEMVEPGGVRSFEDRKRLWEGIHQDTPQVAESPWTKVITQAVAAEREERFTSASALARALEEVTLRAAGDETARPYPGLAAFQQEDAEFFFGRELEVEALWKKLRRPHLLAVIGPSGAGKSSFLRAGLLPTLTDGWQALITTPGTRPFANLARALAEQLPQDPDTVDALLRFEEPEVAVELISRWREGSRHGLIILDQFEELFTQNPEETQAAFAEFLGALPLKVDAHVLLSMRDDFLLHCSELESLAPVFSELSPLRSLSGASMRRAIVEPALRCGYRFEEESIIDEMLTEVEGERGALPMVAFSAAQLWERRDRDQGLLTRDAYEAIGGVGGALAQHAEATLDEIGEEHIPIVRELFRNLVTAQGTRAARDRDELLSVFSGDSEAAAPARGFEPPGRKPRRAKAPGPTGGLVGSEQTAERKPGAPRRQREDAEHVLDTLIDARLLSSYEVPASDEDDVPHHRIEIVHESLLANWPRLVRWRTQDAEGAQLRDELRSQARLWDDHGRLHDYLWTGTAYKEYELWRERYPGGLTTLEEDFARAMTSHAERRKRRRRITIAAAFVMLLTVLAVVGGFWRQSVAEARRAEAAKLLALGQLHLETDPTEALAYTTASLELSDTDGARAFALRALWEAPPALELEPGGTQQRSLNFSPDGNRLAVGGNSEEVRVFSAEGGQPVVLRGHGPSPGGTAVHWASNQLLVTLNRDNRGEADQTRARVWALPGGRLLRTIDLFGKNWTVGPRSTAVGNGRLFAEVTMTDPASDNVIFHLRSWRLPDGEPEELGRVDWTALGARASLFDPYGNGWIYRTSSEIFYRQLPVREGVPDRLVGGHDNEPLLPLIPTEPDRFWSLDSVTHEWRLWDLSSSTGQPLRVVQQPTGLEEGTSIRPDASARWGTENLWRTQGRQVRLWNLDAWLEARPLRLRRSGSWTAALSSLGPSGDWLVAATHGTSRATFWPLSRAWPYVVDGYSSYIRFITFSPDSRWLATSWTAESDVLRLWPLPGNESREVRSLALPEKGSWTDCAFDPRGRFLLVGGFVDRTYIVPLDGSPPRELETPSGQPGHGTVAVSPSGRRVATAFTCFAEMKTLRVWDLDTGELRIFDLPLSTASTKTGCEGAVRSLEFTGESTLYTAGDGGVRRWDLESGNHELVLATKPGLGVRMSLASDGRTAVVREAPFMAGDVGPLKLLDLATAQEQVLPAYGEGAAFRDSTYAIDHSGTVVASSDEKGIIRVGRVNGGEPHLLVGHEGPAWVAISPDGRWIASAGEDNTLRLWPMPDLDKPPLHTLPREELIAKLKSLTNIRVVRDPDSADGWSVQLDPFPGWQEVPQW